jgi:hypothetical protein
VFLKEALYNHSSLAEAVVTQKNAPKH